MSSIARKFEHLGARMYLWLNKKPSSKRERYWSFVLPWFLWGVMLGGILAVCLAVFDRQDELSTSAVITCSVLLALFIGWVVWVLIVFSRKDRDDGYWDALHERHLVNWKQSTEEAKEKLSR